MKKFGGILVAVVLMAAVFSFAVPNLNNSQVSANRYGTDSDDTGTPIAFDGYNPLFNIHPSGIFIIRNEDASNSDNTEFFSGGVSVHRETILDALNPEDRYQTFLFEPVKEIGGDWYTAKEYYETFSEAGSGGVSDWFYVLDNGKYINPVAKWQFRKNSPAGKYAIRARAIEEHTYEGNVKEWTPIIKDDKTVDFFFIIIYGEEFTRIQCLDTWGNTTYKVGGDNGLGIDLKINIFANDGAMDIVEKYIETDPEEDSYTGGQLQGDLDIFHSLDDEISIKVEKNGQAVDPAVLGYSVVTGGINLSLPETLGAGRYVVTVSHSRYEGIIGTYVIDNGDPISEPVSILWLGITFIVIGLLALIGGTGLFVLPKFIYSLNEKRYEAIDKKIYKMDRRSVKEREKAEKANKGQEETTTKNKARSFLAKMTESKRKRDVAREQGISMDELRAHEKQQAEIEETAKFSMSELRKSDENVMITEAAPIEAAPETMRRPGEPEFDLLDSVKEEGAFADQQFIKDVVQRNVSGDNSFAEYKGVVEEDGDKNPEDEPPPTPPHAVGSLLSRIRKLSGE